MKAILIDSKNRTVSQIEVSNAYPDINKAIGVDLICVGTELPGATLYVDDEGLLKSENTVFEFQGAHQPFAGNGVILGFDPNEEEENKDCPYTVEQIRAKVKWTNKYVI